MIDMASTMNTSYKYFLDNFAGHGPYYSSESVANATVNAYCEGYNAGMEYLGNRSWDIYQAGVSNGREEMMREAQLSMRSSTRNLLTILLLLSVFVANIAICSHLLAPFSTRLRAHWRVFRMEETKRLVEMEMAKIETEDQERFGGPEIVDKTIEEPEMKRDAVPASKWLRVFMMMLYPLSVLLALILCNVAPPSKKSILDCDWDYVLFLTASSTLIEAVLSSWKTVKKAEENAETTESEPKETKLIDTKNATTISEGQISEDSGTKTTSSTEAGKEAELTSTELVEERFGKIVEDVAAEMRKNLEAAEGEAWEMID